MAWRTRTANVGTRERYTEDVRMLAEQYGYLEDCPFVTELATLEAGKPVIVAHGYLIDTEPMHAPFVLEPDGRHPASRGLRCTPRRPRARSGRLARVA